MIVWIVFSFFFRGVPRSTCHSRFPHSALKMIEFHLVCVLLPAQFNSHFMFTLFRSLPKNRFEEESLVWCWHFHIIRILLRWEITQYRKPDENIKYIVALNSVRYWLTVYVLIHEDKNDNDFWSRRLPALNRFPRLCSVFVERSEAFQSLGSNYWQHPNLWGFLQLTANKSIEKTSRWKMNYFEVLGHTKWSILEMLEHPNNTAIQQYSNEHNNNNNNNHSMIIQNGVNVQVELIVSLPPPNKRYMPILLHFIIGFKRDDPTAWFIICIHCVQWRWYYEILRDRKQLLRAIERQKVAGGWTERARRIPLTNGKITQNTVYERNS